MFAQLFTPDDACHGLYGFTVPIRDRRTVTPLPGVTAGDMGPRIGLTESTTVSRCLVAIMSLARICCRDPSKRLGPTLGVVSLDRVAIVGVLQLVTWLYVDR